MPRRLVVVERGHIALPTIHPAMYLISTIVDTFAQRLTKGHARHDPTATARIRSAMLALLSTQGSGCETDRVRQRLLSAPDATSLWFLRVNLHQQLTRLSSEEAAMQQVHALRPLFERCVPPSLLCPMVDPRRRSAVSAPQACAQ